MDQKDFLEFQERMQKKKETAHEEYDSRRDFWHDRLENYRKQLDKDLNVQKELHAKRYAQKETSLREE